MRRVLISLVIASLLLAPGAVAEGAEDPCVKHRSPWWDGMGHNTITRFSWGTPRTETGSGWWSIEATVEGRWLKLAGFHFIRVEVDGVIVEDLAWSWRNWYDYTVIESPHRVRLLVPPKPEATIRFCAVDGGGFPDEETVTVSAPWRQGPNR